MARSVSSVLVPGSTGWRYCLVTNGVQDARLEASGGEGTLDEAVIAAGAFDGDEAITELVLGKGVADLGDGGVECGAVVLDGGGRNQDVAIEIGEEELGAELGTVKADDAEVIGADLLDAGVPSAAGLGDAVVKATVARALAGTGSGQGNCLRNKGCGSSHFRSWQFW